jgi:YggT family protein
MGPYFAYIVNLLFVTYTALIFLRLLSSWFPGWQGHKLVHFLAFYTDPFLNLFRRILPPLGGRIDLSPILAILALRILESLILGLFRWIF